MLTRTERTLLILTHLDVVDVLTGALCRRFPRYACYAEDLRQEGIIELIHSVSAYDASRGVLFKTFLWPRMVAALRRAAVRLYRPATGVAGAERADDFGLESVLSPFDTAADVQRRVDASRLWTQLVRDLKAKRGGPNAERDVLLFLNSVVLSGEHGQDHGLSALAREHGFSRERARQVRDKVQVLFNEWLQEQDRW